MELILNAVVIPKAVLVDQSLVLFHLHLRVVQVPPVVLLRVLHQAVTVSVPVDFSGMVNLVLLLPSTVLLL